MPHLSEVQAEYRDYDVTVIGISDEPLHKVVNFLFKKYKDGKIHNERTSYTLATDPDKSVYNAYMKAAGQRGIPTSFIIGKDSQVEWIGHPMGIDEPLEAVVKDSWDRDAFRAELVARKANEAKADEIMARLRKTGVEKEWDAHLAALDELIALGDGYENYTVQKFIVQLKYMDDPKAAYAFGRDICKDNWDDPMFLNQLAWFTVDEDDIKTRDLDFALKAAMRANELTDAKDAAILDTIARINYEKGNYQAAVEWQQKAVDRLSGNEPFADDLRDVLDKYKTAAKKSY